MYKRYYDGYGRVRREADQGEVIVPHSPDDEQCHNEDRAVQLSPHSNECGDIAISGCRGGNSLFGLELDDLILVGVLIFLLMNNDGDDPLMPIIIGIILIGELL